MAALHLKYPVAKAMRHVTMTVDLTGVRTWRMRLWLGGLLVQLAARVMGCGIRFDGPTTTADPPPPTARERGLVPAPPESVPVPPFVEHY